MQFIKNFIAKIFNILGYQVYKLDSLYFAVGITEFDKKNIKTALEYSITNSARMWSLIECINYINNYKIPGDIVECGVYKGGNILLADIYNSHLEMNKRIWAFDTFAGMSTPTDRDLSDYEGGNAKATFAQFNKSQKNGYNEWCYSSLDEVKANLNRHLSNINNLKFIVGKVEDTLLDDSNIPDKISILRLDTDWYESTKKELEVLYPRLVSGGILIIDDYGHWKGAQKAVDEFFKDEVVFLYKVDYSCRFLIKK